MDRRSFLKLFAAAGPVAVVAPKYFFAPVGGWHSDVIVHPGNPESWESIAAAQELSLHGLDGLRYWQDAKHVGDYSGIERQPFVVITQEITIAEAQRRWPFSSIVQRSAAPRANPRRGLSL